MIKVRNAVILAAGAGTRFVPLSLEQPKGLFEVNGEKLIDRQIVQLQEAGIKDITVVLGYKKEMLYYLEEKYGAKLVFNPYFNTKNNIESLCLAKNFIGDTYICSCDDYFLENPFRQEEPYSFYAGLQVSCKTNEMFVDVDADNRITSMEKGRNSGKILLGHSFWAKDFSEKFFELVKKNQDSGKYNNSFWEVIVKDNLDLFPPFFFKEYPSEFIHEFDYFEELREFDKSYINNTNSKILSNIKTVFHCNDSDIVSFRCINEGLTNTSFIFRVFGCDYIYRHPGEGTERIINRKNEKSSLDIAKSLGIDPTYIYMDENEGWKISKYVPAFREPDYDSFADSKKVVEVIRNLHDSGIKVDYGLRPWEDACLMEGFLKQSKPGCFKDYEQLKNKVEILYRQTLGDGVSLCFCHGDTYKHNWMFKPDGSVVLIDWEYSGMSDPGIDVGYYIVDAMYDIDTAKVIIKEYLKDQWSPKKEFHFLAYVAIIAYYWFVWALYRELCGADMGESLVNWREMAERYTMI